MYLPLKHTLTALLRRYLEAVGRVFLHFSPCCLPWLTINAVHEIERNYVNVAPFLQTNLKLSLNLNMLLSLF